MHVARRTALGLDVLVHPLRLLDAEVNDRCDLLDRNAVGERIQAQIHLGVRQCEVEFLLRLRHRIGVRRGRPAANLVRHPQVRRELVDLRFIQVCDRLEIGCPVALFDEEPLVVFQAVGGARDGIVKPVGVVVLGHLADALLVIGGRHQLQVRLCRHPLGLPHTARVLDGQLEHIEPVTFQNRWQRDLALPAVAILRKHFANRLILPCVAAKPLERWRDVLDDRVDAGGHGEQAGRAAVRRRRSRARA